MKLLTKCLSLACALGMLGGFATRAPAQEEKCRDKVYNTSRGVIDAEQKNNRKACVKEGGNEACVAGDSAKGEAKEAKLEALFGAGEKCDPIPAFGVNTSSSPLGDDIGDAAQGAADTIARVIFGDPVTGATAGDKCHDKTIQRSGQKAVAIWKAFRKCAKTAASQAAVDGCVATGIGDAKAGSKQAKLDGDVADRCTIPDAAMADGACGSEVTAAAFSACVGNAVDCEVCSAINTMTGGTANCDQLDNGVIDGSCAAPIGLHKCTLDSGSQVDLFGGALTTTLAATGAVDINCGAQDPGTGKTTCACTVQAPGFGQLNVPGVGFACVKPSTGSCPVGEVDCDGGNSLDLDLDGNVDINASDADPTDGMADQTAPCTGNADCLADCTTFCGGAGNVFNAGCAGFCSAGAQAACTDDMDCLPADGACNGQNGVPSGNTCECTCIDAAAGPAAPAGALSCQLAFALSVEQLAGTPCDGVGILINLGNTCAPLTTETVTAVINNANDLGGTLPAVPPFTTTGAEIPCATLSGSSTSGMTLVGAAAFYGSTIGDLLSGLTVICQ